LLRRAGLFTDPGADTATDPVLRRDTLVDLLRPVLARGVRVGLTCADFIDHASTRLLRAFADTARLAVEHGLDASGLVLGTVGRLPPELRLEQAELRDVPGPPADSIRLTDDMQGVLSLVAAAPHPVNASSLKRLWRLGTGELDAALRQLAAVDLVEIGARIALGPAGQIPADPESALRWRDTPEVRIPQARLAVCPEPGLAKHLAQEALSCGDADVAAHCFSLAGALAGREALLYAEALASSGRPGAANELFQQHKAEAPPLQAGRVAALLAAQGLVGEDEAHALLRRAERGGEATAARPVRAELLLGGGHGESAYNLLRRTTRQELESAPPSVRLRHLLAKARCSDNPKALQEAAIVCATRAERRQVARLAGDPARMAKLAAEDLDAAALRKLPRDVVRDALPGAFTRHEPISATTAKNPAGLFERLREHGATLLAALVGDELVLHPPGAAARPGLSAQLKTKLLGLREHPHAVAFGRDEFSTLGPFSGQSALVLRRVGEAGPVLVLFRASTLPDVSHLL